MLRSVAVMLASPLVALPLGEAREPVEEAPPVLAEPAPKPESPVERRERAVRATEPAAGGSDDREPVLVSVDCSNDGCVVQDGLDVVVLGRASDPR